MQLALLDYTQRLRALGGLDVDEGIGMTKPVEEYIYTPPIERPDLLLAHSYGALTVLVTVIHAQSEFSSIHG